MITPEQLQAAGWQVMNWNGGSFQEYWRPLSQKQGFGYRLSVRFGEYIHIPFIVYIITSSAMLQLRHIQTLPELECLFALLREPC